MQKNILSLLISIINNEKKINELKNKKRLGSRYFERATKLKETKEAEKLLNQ